MHRSDVHCRWLRSVGKVCFTLAPRGDVGGSGGGAVTRETTTSLRLDSTRLQRLMMYFYLQRDVSASGVAGAWQ